MQLKLQLQTTKKGDSSVDDYIMKMRGFADLLAAAGKTISDDDLALQILAGFGMEYDAVVVNFTNTTRYKHMKSEFKVRALAYIQQLMLHITVVELIVDMVVEVVWCFAVVEDAFQLEIAKLFVNSVANLVT